MSEACQEAGAAYLADEQRDPTPRLLEELTEQEGSILAARVQLDLEPNPSSSVERKIGAFVCGDCGAVLSDGQSCSHISIAADGKRTIQG